MGICKEDAGGSIGTSGFGCCGLVARSKNEANLPSKDCHFVQSSAVVNKQYFMLLRNSTSIIWTSFTLMPETSAHVLLV